MPFAGCLRLSCCDQRREPLAILGKIDAVGRRAEDRNARQLQPLRKLQRRLAAELDDQAEQFAMVLLAPHDLENVLRRQGLEIETVRRVRVGRDRLRIAVHHDHFEAGAGCPFRSRPSAKAAWQQQ